MPKVRRNRRRARPIQGAMLTDVFLTTLWLWGLARVPPQALVIALDTLPSRYGPRARA